MVDQFDFPHPNDDWMFADNEEEEEELPFTDIEEEPDLEEDDEDV